jgi:hypothetical protein
VFCERESSDDGIFTVQVPGTIVRIPGILDTIVRRTSCKFGGAHSSTIVPGRIVVCVLVLNSEYDGETF